MDWMLQFYSSSIWFKSTFFKNSVISHIPSVNYTPSAKDNDLPKMKHGVGNTGRYMLKCTNLLKDATMDSDHLGQQEGKQKRRIDIIQSYSNYLLVEAVSRNIQYMHENVFESNKKLIRENYAIVKFNTFCIYTDKV